MEWKDIPGYEGLYRVSNTGQVGKVLKDGNLKPMKPWSVTGGYLQIGLSRKEDGRKKIKVHQLVAMAFLDHVPCGHDIVVDHIDNDVLNNNVSNLRLVTARFNATRRPRGENKHVGVSWNKQYQKWYSRITINGVSKFLGSFDDEEEAHKVYVKASKECVIN